jgi:hypothetical protein
MTTRDLSLCAGLILTALATLATPRSAHACPCITLVGSHADEVAQRALVVVNDDSLDYVVQLAIEGEATELGWLVPTPALPEDPVLVDDTFLDSIDDATAPFLHACSGGGGCAAETLRGDYAQNDVTVWSEGRIDNLDFAVLSSSSGSDLGGWLTSHGYALDAGAQTRVDSYVSRGWFFVAMRVSGAALEGDRPSLGPIRIHIPYTGSPVFPLGMTALSTSERVQLLFFVAAAQRLVPANYPRVQIDGDALRADEQGGSNYDALVRRAVDAQGKGFLVEYAAEAPSYAAPEPSLEGILQGKQMVRLYTDVEPASLDQDLELQADATVETPYYPCVAAEGTEASGCAGAGQASGALPLLVALSLVASWRRRLG